MFGIPSGSHEMSFPHLGVSLQCLMFRGLQPNDFSQKLAPMNELRRKLQLFPYQNTFLRRRKDSVRTKFCFAILIHILSGNYRFYPQQ